MAFYGFLKMKKWEEIAIRLKYQGKTHREIASEVEKLTRIKVSESTIRTYFNTNGRLYIPYVEYSSRNDEYIEEEVRKQFKDAAKNASKIMRSLLQMAIKRGDLRLAKDILESQMDRAGLTVVKKVEVEKTEKKVMTDEQLYSELERMGLDPKTGFRIRGKEAEPN